MPPDRDSFRLLEVDGFKISKKELPCLTIVALPERIKKWSLRTLKEKLIKIGAKVVRHSRYVIFQMAEAAVSRSLFAEILARIRRLWLVAVASAGG